jgi:hypothetical protein
VKSASERSAKESGKRKGKGINYGGDISNDGRILDMLSGEKEIIER